MKRFTTTLVCLALISAALGAYAAVEVVTPNNMGNWLTYLKQSSTGNASFAFADMAPAGSTIGQGAFYACAGTGAGTGATAGGQVWLGNNQYAGTKIRDITKLEYTTFTHVCGNGPAPSQNDYCRQPIQLQIAVVTNPEADPSAWEWAYLMHRPWGMIGANDNNPNLHMEFWETWNAMAFDSVWYVAYNNWSVGLSGTWADIVTAHPNAVLTAPPFNTSWAPPSNGSQCSLSFEVGNRKKSNAYVFGTTNYATWWKEAEGFKGYLDKFTIEAIDTTTDPGNPVTVIPETTYDFESDTPMAQTVHMTLLSAWSNIISLHRNDALMFKFAFVRLFGKVLAEEFDPSGRKFRMDDGSGKPILVSASNSTPASPDAYVMVTGTLHQVLWEKEIPPINDRKLICQAEDVVLVFP